MAKSTPTQHAVFVRHVEGRQTELSHRIYVRRVIFDAKRNGTKEDILCSAQLNHLPSYFHVDIPGEI
jgi:hypothetical protein